MASLLRRRRAPTVVAFAAATCLIAGLTLTGSRALAATTSVAATADTYASSASAGSNFGTDSNLRIDGSPLVRSYLQFDLTGLSGTISSAHLRLYADSSSGLGYEVDRTGSGWTETGLTWNSRPATGSTVGKSSTFAANSWTDVDVTSAVAAGSVAEFEIVALNGTAITFDSREAANPPELVLTYTGVPSPTPTPTATPTATASPTPTGTSSPTVAATADTYASSASAGSNFGTDSNLRIDGSPLVRSYLQFNLTGLSGTISSAHLRLYADSSSGLGYEVDRTGSGWTETGLTWNSRPATGSTVGKSSTFAANSWTDVDVTSAVAAGSVAEFEIVALNGTAITFDSREAANPPELVLTYTGVPSPTPTPTATPTATASPTASPTPKPSTSPTAQPTPSPTPKPTASPTVGPTPPSGDTVLLASGDVRTNLAGITATAKLIGQFPGDPMLDVGDDTANGSAALYQSYFNPTWGQYKDRIHPTPGNHGYSTSGAAPYFAYWGAAAGSASKSWYSFDLPNNWHVIELNSNISHGVGSPQEVWLRTDLAANAGKHIIAFWHSPRFSSGAEHGSDSSFTPFWQDLYAAHADLVFDGHDHDYERFALQNPSGQADPNGIREFVVGMGGAPLYAFTSIVANSEARNDTTYGILTLTLHAHSYSWQFIPQAGKTYSDSGTQATHS